MWTIKNKYLVFNLFVVVQAGTGSLPAVSGGAAPASTLAGVFTFGDPTSSFTPEVKANSLFNTGSFT